MLPDLKKMLSNFIEHRAVTAGLEKISGYMGKITNGSKLENRTYDNGDNKVRLQHGNFAVFITTVAELDLLIIKTFINYIPNSNRDLNFAMYYELLDMNDELLTGDSYFCIAAGEEVGSELDVISVEARRPIADTSESEFMRCLSSVVLVSGIYMPLLAEKFKAPPVE